MDDGPPPDGLADISRLALAYAPVSARASWATWLALDSRLAAIVRGTQEPMLGQIRLAWWRERLGEAPAAWPQGEPVLAALSTWSDARRGLQAMVDGWECLLGAGPLSAEAIASAAQGRADGIVALAAELGAAGDVAPLARAWALADLASHFSDPAERAIALEMLREHSPTRSGLPRAMRPLVILHDIARRQAEGIHIGPIGGLLRTMRLGMFGR